MNEIKKTVYTNRLIDEASPYLLAHAHNPVDWYPWGEEAFQKATTENKLIFLSIGYHACHWCHVMEAESFEDEEVAALLNDHYICIKVDREERKDLDAVYMKVCQAITGSGGWPLNVWLTPDKLPILAGTYFPKRNYMNRPGLMETATYISTAYKEEPQNIQNRALDIMDGIKKSDQKKHEDLNISILDQVHDDFISSFDPVYGGFSKAPKFPVPHQLLYLMESGEDQLIKMALKTLKQMIKGGIYDHIGGGFARYAVDAKWLIPHFEKMLYDNSLLLDVLCKAYEVSLDPVFKTVALEVKRFMRDELGHNLGGFYAAYDADSEGVEGKYYRFTKREILKVLGDQDGEEFCQLYDVTESGNFEGFSILNLINGELDSINDLRIKTQRDKLKNYREKRIKPALDDKILAMSNGFAIHGLMTMYEVFEDEEALEMAVRAEAYIHKYMIRNGELLVSLRHNVGAIGGTLDDYGAYIRGLLKLFAVTQEDIYLKRGLLMMEVVLSTFWDQEQGGFFAGKTSNRELIYNPKELYDGATPSGNSLMAFNLLFALIITEDVRYKRYLDDMVASLSADLNRYRIHASYFMSVIRKLQLGTKEVRIYVKDAEAKERIVKSNSYLMLQGRYIHDMKLVLINPEKCIDQLPTLYFCNNGACQMPELL